jgi:hypothetical protein
MIVECPALQPLRTVYARLFTADTSHVCAFMWQPARFAVARFIIQALALSVPAACITPCLPSWPEEGQ